MEKMKTADERCWMLNFFWKVDMFSALSVLEMDELIDQMKKVSFQSGETIVEQGHIGDSFFIIYKGRVQAVLKKDDLKISVLGELGPEQFFGEMALLLDQPRSATIIAKENTDCFVLLKSEFQYLTRHNPTFSKLVLDASEQRSLKINQKS